MKEKAYIFLAEGFEEVEALTVVDILRRGQIDLTTVSVGEQQLVTGSHGIPVMADCLFAAEKLEDGTLYILPGGMPGTRNLGKHSGLTELLCTAKKQGKRLAAICAAPSVFGQLGLLKGEAATCYPGVEEELSGAEVLERQVVVSGQMTTSRSVGTAIPFALKLVEQLKGEKEAEKIANSIVWGFRTTAE